MTKTPIIPIKPTFIGEQRTLDHEAICVFAATGFFLDEDTYYKEQKVIKPATEYTIDNGQLITENTYFKWNYNPITRSLEQIVAEFADLFENIVKEQVGERKTILPLSGGLDSRTQAAALHHLKVPVHAYGYAFENGHDETRYGKQIAKTCGFPFDSWRVPKGYLWDKIEALATINGCYSEFTHPRQMAFTERYAALGEVFSLGHWGDVLFDDMGVEDALPLEKQVDVLLKKVVKKGGMDLATALWNAWGLEGDFEAYLRRRIKGLTKKMNISQNANAQIRAFKSTYWAPRWTSVNLSVFEHARPITLPYYDNRMCEFICTVPEKHLTGRKIQIEYLKMRAPALAKIVWQAQKPYNLYNYPLNKPPRNLPYRIVDKLKRMAGPKPYVQRNWELQFLGDENQRHLKQWLFENEKFKNLLPASVVGQIFKGFTTEDPVYYSHPLSMLLTLSLFAKTQGHATS